MMRWLKCVVAGYNAQGEPDFWFVKIRVRQSLIDGGYHIRVAEHAAKDDDFEPKLVYDEDDAACRAILEHFDWDGAMLIDTEPVDKLWTFYVLECCDGSYYTGITLDLNRRVAKHNRGTGAKYTRSRRPVRVVFSKVISGKSDALKQEAWFKKQSRQMKEAIIRQGFLEGFSDAS